MKPGQAIASFDSASAMLRVLAAHLHGASSPLLGLGPVAHTAARILLPAVNRLPPRARESVYRYSGAHEAIPQRRLASVDVERIAAWVADRYPRRRYPVVFIGSSSGAMLHLAALAGAPWLPQTLLVPVHQSGIDPDDAPAALSGLAAARDAFTAANPQISLHHMHDANQDRLMIQRMAYFRYKYRRLPTAYAAFLSDCLEPGGSVLVIECEKRWPSTTTGERQVFQHGAVGGAEVEEYQQGGPRVARFLTERGSSHRTWRSPPADVDSPEAEWGFDRDLLPDLTRLCDRHGWRLERLRFPASDALSAPVAEIYRAWYAEHGVDADRLLVDCFALLDVHLPLSIGLVPFWTTFNTLPARDSLLAYLDGSSFDEILVGLFSHGIRSIGNASIADWDQALARARRHAAYCGVDTSVYPQDFAAYLRFHDRLAGVRKRTAVPHPAEWSWLRKAADEVFGRADDGTGFI